MRKINLVSQCYIGKYIKITKSQVPLQEGMQGKIVDETKLTFSLETSDGKKRLIKEKISFTIKGDSNNIINGKDITKRPEDRIKLRIKNE